MKAIRILFDYQIFSAQIYGGISRYFFELMRNFEDDNEIEYDLSLRYSNNDYLRQSNRLPHESFFKNISFRGKQRILNILNKKISKKNISKGNYDIFHPTYSDPYFLDFLNNKPFVLTIYDMIHEIFPKMFSPGDKTKERKKILAQKAAKIIAISENTKMDVIKFFGIMENKIEVIYPATPASINKNNYNINIELPEKYILFVGSRKSYKNFDLFIEAISPLIDDAGELNLVCAGGGKFNNMEIEKFKSLNIKDKVFYYSGSDNVLSCLYRKALTFVFPSLYEGFGIPVLESFTCGCPVICSGVSSLPEVAGDAAIYFDPSNRLSILNNVKKLIYNNELRSQLIYKGFQRAKKFTWRETTKQTKKVYEDIL